MKYFASIGVALAALLIALPALAAEVITDPGVDPMAFLQQILAAVQAHNLLLAVPLIALIVIFGLRKIGVRIPKIGPWFATDQGGAVLSLLAAIAEATIAAAVLPGPHAAVATILWVCATLVRNHALYKWVKKALAGTRFEPWLALLPADEDPSAPAPVVKALLLFALAGGLLFSMPARADEASATTTPAVAATPAPAPAAGPAPATTPAVLWSVGPTVPLFKLTFSDPHPVAIQAGAGLQLSVSLPQLQHLIAGKLWDMGSLELMAFGTIVAGDKSADFGALSVALAVCTMSNLICIGGGKDLVTATGLSPGKNGWFVVAAISFNIGLAAPAPRVVQMDGLGGAPGATTQIIQMDGVTMPKALVREPARGNTLYLSQ
jgi:hypothetical protein